jgi:hypothetical protein
MFDEMINRMRKERQRTQMTLGGLIDTLVLMPLDQRLPKLEAPHSYRGYYEDLAFTAGNGSMRVDELLKLARDQMGQLFYGYKGGEYYMNMDTPLWIANYGECGLKLVGITDAGYVTQEDE